MVEVPTVALGRELPEQETEVRGWMPALGRSLAALTLGREAAPGPPRLREVWKNLGRAAMNPKKAPDASTHFIVRVGHRLFAVPHLLAIPLGKST